MNIPLFRSSIGPLDSFSFHEDENDFNNERFICSGAYLSPKNETASQMRATTNHRLSRKASSTMTTTTSMRQIFPQNNSVPPCKPLLSDTDDSISSFDDFEFNEKEWDDTYNSDVLDMMNLEDKANIPPSREDSCKLLQRQDENEESYIPAHCGHLSTCKKNTRSARNLAAKYQEKPLPMGTNNIKSSLGDFLDGLTSPIEVMKRTPVQINMNESSTDLTEHDDIDSLA